MPDQSKPLHAALWMIGAILAFSSMAIAGRAVAIELDTFELMMYRSFIGIAIMTAIGLATGRLAQIRTERFGLHLLRNVSHFTGQNLWFFALGLLPLSQLFALEFTSPIWVVLFATLFLGERLTRTRLLAVGIGFLGALLVAAPTGSSTSVIGLITASLAAIGFAGSIVATKLLTRTDGIFTILFWLTAIQSILGMIAVGWDGDVAWPGAAIWPWVIMVGLAGLIAHTCLTNALSVAPATVVVPMDFLRLPAIAIVGLLFYDEPLTLTVFVGAVLIFGGNYLNIWTERRP